MSLVHIPVPTGSITAFGGSSAPGGWLTCDGSAVSRTTYASLFSVISTTYGTGDGSTTFNLPDLRSRTPIGTGAGAFSTTFANTDVSTGADTITVPSNTSLYDGTAVLFTAGATPPSPLVTSTTYYVIRLSATSISLATTRANAVAATAIDLTSQGTGTNTLSITYTNNSLGAKGGEETHSLTLTEIPSHTHSGAPTLGGPSLMGSGGTPALPVTATQATGSAGLSGAHNILNPFLSVNYIIKY